LKLKSKTKFENLKKMRNGNEQKKKRKTISLLLGRLPHFWPSSLQPTHFFSRTPPFLHDRTCFTRGPVASLLACAVPMTYRTHSSGLSPSSTTRSAPGISELREPWRDPHADFLSSAHKNGLRWAVTPTFCRTSPHEDLRPVEHVTERAAAAAYRGNPHD
jgi:hypothetical protein